MRWIGFEELTEVEVGSVREARQPPPPLSVRVREYTSRGATWRMRDEGGEGGEVVDVHEAEIRERWRRSE